MLFNRKTLNPIYGSKHEKMLSALRRRGFTRLCELRCDVGSMFKDAPPNKFWKTRSSAYTEAMFFNRKGVFVDMGAGNSPDATIAKMDGFKKAYMLDLFPTSSLLATDYGVISIKADICEKLPFKSCTVDLIICQAVLPLMNERDRILFYRNAYRILKKGGQLSVYFCKLKNEHPWNIQKERKNALAVGFGLQRNNQGTFLISK